MGANLVLQALRHVWLTLEALGNPLALMGGLALSLWKRVRITPDVDLLIGIEQIQVPAILTELQRAGIRTKHHPPLWDLGTVRIVHLLYEPPGAFIDLQIDLLLAESDYHREALSRRVSVRIPVLDIDVFVLSCEDLILHKLIAGRIIDRVDVVALLRANKKTLDMDYLGA